MLNPYVHSFLDVPVADSFVNDDPDSALRDVVYDTRFPMVNLVWHSGTSERK